MADARKPLALLHRLVEGRAERRHERLRRRVEEVTRERAARQDAEAREAAGLGAPRAADRA